MIYAALTFLVLFCILAAVDGTYFHFSKYKLDQRPESLREHAFHTARSLFFAPMVLILFTFDSSGWLLWLAVLLVALDSVALVLDLLEEEKSRKDIGGLSRAEYLIHVLANGFHFTWVALILASKDSADWALDGGIVGDASTATAVISGVIALGGVLGAIDHSVRLKRQVRRYS
ncbi:hypothetical protein N9D31_00265 [Oligoflexaceae bacterium]|nr:hypothetical protein [Oligoflexaceae bacterium]